MFLHYDTVLGVLRTSLECFDSFQETHCSKRHTSVNWRGTQVPVTLTACFGIFQPWALQQGLVKGLLNWWPQQHWAKSKAVQWKPESKGTLLAIWMYPMLNLPWTKEDLRYLSQWNHGQTFSMEPVRAQNSAPRKRQWLPNLKESLLVRFSIIFRAMYRQYRVWLFSLCPQHTQIADSEVETLVCPFCKWPGQGFYVVLFLIDAFPSG